MSTPAFAILRTQKLKHINSITRSLKHSFREQDTPNADMALTPDNTCIGAQSSQEALANIQSLLPEKRRKDAVLCIEYLITASPEIMATKSREEQDAYFNDSLRWIKQKHGEKHLAYAGIHLDEKTPHLYAYVVPLDTETGRLNAKKWLGGAKALNALQTEFAEQVGKPHRLERGIEGSRSKHQTVKAFYGHLDKEIPEEIGITPQSFQPKVLKKGIFRDKMESPEMVAERLTKALHEVYTPIAQKASVASQERRSHKNLQEVASRQQNAIKANQTAFKGLSQAQMREIEKFILTFHHENHQAREHSRQQAVSKTQQGPDLDWERER